MILTKSERMELQRQARASNGRADSARHARLILLLAEGRTWAEIRAKLDCNDSYIARWSQRFATDRLAGLFARYAGRARYKVTDRIEARVLGWTTNHKPGDGSTHWSSRKLATELGDLSHMREALRIELGRLQREKHSTTLFVTHDQIEAMTMADRVGVLREGILVQIGTPREIYDKPATTFVAKMVGVPRINLFNAEASDNRIRLNNSQVQLPLPAAATVPQSFTLGFRPEDVQIEPDGVLAGEVALLEPLGVETIVHIKSGEQTLLSSVSGIAPFKLGNAVRFNIVRERLHFFRKEDGKRL